MELNKMTYIKSTRELTEEELKTIVTHEHYRKTFIKQLLKEFPNLRTCSDISTYISTIKERSIFSYFNNPVVSVYLQWEYDNSLGVHVYNEKYFLPVKKILESLGNGDNTIWIEYD
jgi:hypothetical protein